MVLIYFRLDDGGVWWLFGFFILIFNIKEYEKRDSRVVVIVVQVVVLIVEVEEIGSRYLGAFIVETVSNSL